MFTVTFPEPTERRRLPGGAAMLALYTRPTIPSLEFVTDLFWTRSMRKAGQAWLLDT